MSSIMRRRNGLIASSVMGMLLSWSEGLLAPHLQDRAPRPAIVLGTPVAPAPYRASGLVRWSLTDARARLAPRATLCVQADVRNSACLHLLVLRPRDLDSWSNTE